MKRTPLKRSKPLRRKRPRRIDRETPAEKYWKGPWLHSRPCVGLRSFTGHVCTTPVQQMHLRDHTGIGLKSSNFTSIPGCQNLHASYDQAFGVFAPLGLEGRKSWFACRLIEERADFELEHGCTAEEYSGSPRELVGR